MRGDLEITWYINKYKKLNRYIIKIYNVPPIVISMSPTKCPTLDF